MLLLAAADLELELVALLLAAAEPVLVVVLVAAEDLELEPEVPLAVVADPVLVVVLPVAADPELPAFPADEPEQPASIPTQSVQANTSTNTIPNLVIVPFTIFSFIVSRSFFKGEVSISSFCALMPSLPCQ